MVPVTWQAIEERKTITPAVWSVSGYLIDHGWRVHHHVPANITRVGVRPGHLSMVCSLLRLRPLGCAYFGASPNVGAANAAIHAHDGQARRLR